MEELQRFYDLIYMDFIESKQSLTDYLYSRAVDPNNNVLKWETVGLVSKKNLIGFKVGDYILPIHMEGTLTQVLRSTQEGPTPETQRNIKSIMGSLIPRSKKSTHDKDWQQHDTIFVLGYDQHIVHLLKGKRVLTLNEEYCLEDDLTVTLYTEQLMLSEQKYPKSQIKLGIPKDVPILVIDDTGHEILKWEHYLWKPTYFSQKGDIVCLNEAKIIEDNT